ncbi:hypothetical protein Z043_105523 [Scleropages formosus]|uniref:Centrosomal protein of 78 kDa-like n=1 Tax=Scleropages formosus TaxID=113540 RepID=A0A0P7Z3S4_SCLFO|nr:hypothetical protein Z043_105523 [Scleropages formosus]
MRAREALAKADGRFWGGARALPFSKRQRHETRETANAEERSTMLDSVQIRRRGALDFKSYYDYACALQDTLPVAAVKATVNQGVLDFSGDRLKLADWTPILHALAINKHLHHVAIRSSYQPAFGEPDRHKLSFRKRIPAFRSKDMTFQLCKAIRECLSISPSLRTLQLYGLPLRPRDLIILTKGLAKSESLEHLSLAYCPIADEGLETICQSVKYSTSIKTVDFTGCNLTWRGAEHMANIIKHQAMRRHSVAWAESLRYRKPQLESMSGLRRITLSCNMLIGDRGAAVLAQELAEDLWVKALDIQKCGLSNVGAKALLEALESNTTITVLDIRKNPLVDNSLIKAVIEKVLLNTDENSSQGASCVKITVETESESEEAESPRQTPVLAPQEKITVHQYKRLQVELEEYRLRLAEERKARLTADACLVELELENKRLRNINMSLTEAMQTQHSTSSALEDDAVLECIEASFRKFHAFLDLLKDAGLEMGFRLHQETGQTAPLSTVMDFQRNTLLGRSSPQEAVGQHL